MLMRASRSLVSDPCDAHRPNVGLNIAEAPGNIRLLQHIFAPAIVKARNNSPLGYAGFFSARYTDIVSGSINNDLGHRRGPPQEQT